MRVKYEIYDQNKFKLFNALVASAPLVFGLLGLFASRRLIRYGTWNLFMTCEICIIIGTAISYIDDQWIFLVGRTIFGAVAVGIAPNVASIYID